MDQSIEVQIANFLPCVWYYRELGKYFAEHSSPKNPYQDYMDSLVDIKFIKDVDMAISIFDKLGESASLEIRDHMLSVFAKNAKYEVDFTNDAYNI